ncbi:MAG: non-canonical purine NTP pyrophosphatase [Pseudomonadota bacterium]
MRRLKGDRLLIATHNVGKLEEFQTLLAPYGLTCLSNADFNLPEPAETEATFIGNARIKAQAAVEATGLPALADDSGIEVDGLDGAPGVQTADWAETPTGRDFGIAMERTWRELEARQVAEPRTARFRATLVLMWPDGEEAIFEGCLDGRVVWPMRGIEGHGYDPIFQPTGYDQTLGEMTADQKNGISHRARALREMIRVLGDRAGP